MIKCNQLFLNISISLQTVLAADAHLAAGQLSYDEPAVNIGKSKIFWIVIRILTVSSK